VDDEVVNKPEGLTMRQLWHSCFGDQLLFSSEEETKCSEKWHSSYYGIKEKCEQKEFITKTNRIITTIRYQE
jgi:hypothetical protein